MQREYTNNRVNLHYRDLLCLARDSFFSNLAKFFRFQSPNIDLDHIDDYSTIVQQASQQSSQAKPMQIVFDRNRYPPWWSYHSAYNPDSLLSNKSPAFTLAYDWFVGAEFRIWLIRQYQQYSRKAIDADRTGCRLRSRPTHDGSRVARSVHSRKGFIKDKLKISSLLNSMTSDKLPRCCHAFRCCVACLPVARNELWLAVL